MISFELQGPKRLKTNVQTILATQFYIFQILIPTKTNLNQCGQINHNGHCWTPNQEKGRGGEDNADEI